MPPQKGRSSSFSWAASLLFWYLFSFPLHRLYGHLETYLTECIRFQTPRSHCFLAEPVTLSVFIQSLTMASSFFAILLTVIPDPPKHYNVYPASARSSRSTGECTYWRYLYDDSSMRRSSGRAFCSQTNNGYQSRGRRLSGSCCACQGISHADRVS